MRRVPVVWQCVAASMRCVVASMLAATAAVACAADAEPDVVRMGRRILIPLPISDAVRTRVKLRVQETMLEARQRDARPVLIFEVQPGETEFGQAYELAKFLTSDALNGATTVAYVPKSVYGHGVLVAAACDQIVMSAEAELGDAGRFDRVVGKVEREGYVDIAGRRRNFTSDVALAMLDRREELVVVETNENRAYVLRSRLDELRKERPVQETGVVKPSGQPGVFSAKQARELGFVKSLANSREELAALWKLPREAIEDDPSLYGEWRPVQIDVHGHITVTAAEQYQAIIRGEVDDRKSNLIILAIDSTGGAPVAVLDLANYVAGLKSDKLRTVAYIEQGATGEAVYLALACDHVVLLPEARLAGPRGDLSEDDIRVTARALAENARRKLRSPALATAFVDPQTTVYRCTRADGRVDYFSADGLAALPDKANWTRGEEVTPRNDVLDVSGQDALKLGLASDLVANYDEFKAIYDLKQDPRRTEPTWAMTLITALSRSEVSWFLLFIGAVALYVELQTPGVGLGGIIGALCFILYFWAQYLGGTADWLEVLLFITGVVFLLLELLVFPGVAIFGLVGGLLMVTSLILASQTFVWPHNAYEFGQLRTSLSVVVGAGVASVLAAVALNRFLPHTPMFNRMLLAPPSGDELTRIAEREATAAWEHLVGEQGTSVTPLFPAGKARFGDQLVDVMTGGEFIERGQPVVVVEARGNRVVVKAV